MFESEDARNKIRDELKEKGHTVSFGKSLTGLQDAQFGGINDSFVLQVNNLIGNAKIDENIAEGLKDDIYQMYLASLPDVSMRHRSQHRKGTKGFETDQVRSFAFVAHHTASQLANMIYGRGMGEVLAEAKNVKDLVEMPDRLEKLKLDVAAVETLLTKQIDENTEDHLESDIKEAVENHDADEVDSLQRQLALYRKFYSDDVGDIKDGLDNYRFQQNKLLTLAKDVPQEASTRIADTLSELDKTYNFLMNPGSSDMDYIAGFVRQMGFIFNLGFSVSSGLLNGVQTPGVAIPVVAGRHGYGRTIAAFGQTYAEFGRAVLHMFHKDANVNYDMVELMVVKIPEAWAPWI